MKSFVCLFFVFHKSKHACTSEEEHELWSLGGTELGQLFDGIAVATLSCDVYWGDLREGESSCIMKLFRTVVSSRLRVLLYISWNFLVWGYILYY